MILGETINLSPKISQVAQDIATTSSLVGLLRPYLRIPVLSFVVRNRIAIESFEEYR